MFVLDTDHLTEFQRATSPRTIRLKERVDAARDEFATSIVSVEEVMRGWMAALRRIQDPHGQVAAYAELRRLFALFATWNVLDWDESAADCFKSARQSGIRIATMDLKIACICLVYDATLLTRNRRDFEKVPNLRIEDWLG